MRIALDAFSADNLSGSGAHTSALLRHLPKFAENDELIAIGTPDVLRGLVGWEKEEVSVGGPLSRILFEQWRINGLLQRAKVDVAHFPAAVTSSRPATKTVVSVPDLIFLRLPETFPRRKLAYYRWAIPRSVARADRVITVSEFSKRELIELLGTPEEKIRVTPLGVEPVGEVGLSGEPYQAEPPPEGEYLLYFGTIEPRKNLDRLIRAYLQVRERPGVPPKLVIGGRLGWKYALLLQLLEDPDIKECVRWIGRIPDADLPAWLQKAHAFVWPSRYEGFGLPPLQAMAHGVPVLTSAGTSMVEVAEGVALLVDPENTDAIAEGIVRISTDDDLRARLKTAGPERAAQYTWETTARLTFDVYRELGA